jgi:hypothetical protein
MAVQEKRIRFAIGRAHLIIGRQGMGDAAEHEKADNEYQAAIFHA